MKILILFLSLIHLGYGISLWEAKLVEQKARAAAEAPHPIVRSPAEDTAPKVIVNNIGRIFVVRGAEKEKKKLPSRLELLAKRRIERISNPGV